MPKFRKKPVVIDAIRWTGANVQEVTTFLSGFEVHVVNVGESPDAPPVRCIGRFDYTTMQPTIAIETLEGTMKAIPGDWIIRGVKGEFYPCKPDIFAATYESVTP